MPAASAADADRRPAVVHVTPDPQGRGGMAAVVRGLLASGLSERYALQSITTHTAGSAWRRLATALTGSAMLVVWCARHPEGLVHVHAAVRGSLYRKALVILIARALRRPVLVQVHAGPGDIEAFAARLDSVSHGFLRAALSRAQSVVSVSDASARVIAEVFDLSAVGVIPNAAPPGPANMSLARADAAVYLGGFEDPAKGGIDLLRALPALLDAAPRLHIVLAGPGDPPAGLTGQFGERVSWRGWLDSDEKARTLGEAGIVLMPSRSEGLPIVLLEAMAYGRAVVATTVGGIPELLRGDVDGVLVAPGDADALVAATAQLAGDPARVMRLGDAARERVAELSEARVVARVDAVYRELLSGAEAARAMPARSSLRRRTALCRGRWRSCRRRRSTRRRSAGTG
jgi:glycosyltransferase involved in cell wall biosynthesis